MFLLPGFAKYRPPPGNQRSLSFSVHPQKPRTRSMCEAFVLYPSSLLASLFFKLQTLQMLTSEPNMMPTETTVTVAPFSRKLDGFYFIIVTSHGRQCRPVEGRSWLYSTHWETQKNIGTGTKCEMRLSVVMGTILETGYQEKG